MMQFGFDLKTNSRILLSNTPPTPHTPSNSCTLYQFVLNHSVCLDLDHNALGIT